MNEFSNRVQKAFADAPTSVHKFLVTIELSELDARNDSENDPDIQDVIEVKLEEIYGTRSISVERV